MGADAFSFVTPKAFRTNIVESVEFVAWLWVLAQKVEEKYRDESVRTVILYNMSIVEKDDTRVWFHDLIAEGKQLLGKDLHDRVVDLQDIRNTFHLSKARRALSLKKAEGSFDVVLEVIHRIKKDIQKA